MRPVVERIIVGNLLRKALHAPQPIATSDSVPQTKVEV